MNSAILLNSTLTLIRQFLLCGLVAVALSHPALAQDNGDELANEGMTQEKMAALIAAYTGDVSGPPNRLLFTFEGTDLALISDANANRMRIITPVVPVSELSEEEVIAVLISNYHLALDARYAIGDGLLYSAFIHPLSELTPAQLESAIRQVARLRNSFGTTYSSGELSFGVQQRGEEI